MEGVRSPICPANAYKRKEGKFTNCYTYHLEPLTWQDAILKCKEMWPLASLVCLKTAEEDRFIRDMITNSTDLTLAADFGLWTRGNDIDKEGSFVWTENYGEPNPFIYSNWHPGQPNNVGGDQDCVLLSYPKDGFQWSDVSCSEKHSFICEAEWNQDTGHPGHPSIGNPFG